MSEAKHTPGPWIVREHSDHSGIWIESQVPNVPVTYWGTNEIATKRLWKSEKADSEFRANFDLIAAAPDLLAALKALCSDFEQLYAEAMSAEQDRVRISEIASASGFRNAVIAAIAKAEGKL